MSLFDYQVIPLSLADKSDLSELIFWPQWLSVKQADKLLKTSIESIPWRHDSIKMFGKKVAVPRLQNWFADHTNTSYTYSGICMQAVKFPLWMADLANSVSSKKPVFLLIEHWLIIIEMVAIVSIGMRIMNRNLVLILLLPLLAWVWSEFSS